MAEQKITVKLDPMQVNDLKQFVRDEIEKERRASMRVSPISTDERLRSKLQALDETLASLIDQEGSVSVRWVRTEVRGMLQ